MKLFSVTGLSSKNKKKEMRHGKNMEQAKKCVPDKKDGAVRRAEQGTRQMTMFLTGIHDRQRISHQPT